MRTYRGLVTGMLAVLLAWVCGCVTTPSEQSSDSAISSAPVAAEDAGWELAFSDDFDRAELGDKWTVVDGTWKIQDGMLRGSGTLITSQGYPNDDPRGFQRLEFEAMTDVQPMIFFKNKPKPRVVVGDLSSFIHAQPPSEGNPLRTGYFFQFGGFHNTRNKLLRGGSAMEIDINQDKLITQDQLHKVIVENDMGQVRMFVDGVKILDHKEKQSIMGKDHDRAGFYFYTAAKIANVKVYVKRLPSGLDLE